MSSGCNGYLEWISRRQVLQGAGVAIAAILGGPTALGQIALSKQPKTDNSMVVIFLRGGADGLNALVPYEDDDYYRLRPTLSIPKSATVDLDGFFGLHPALAPLVDLYRDGEMACLHAVGSQDNTRSHFEAMSAMERGLAKMDAGASREAGWIARYLNHTQGVDSPLRAVAFGDVMPDSLRGATSATSLASIADYSLSGSSEYHAALAKLYGSSQDSISKAGSGIMQVIQTLRRLDYKGYNPGGTAKYPTGALGEGLRQTAFLLKANVGLEVAFLEQNGWDTHFAQGGTTGLFAGHLTELSSALKAFATDMGKALSQTTVVVMTEFGRRAYENASFGTDHGRGSFMLVVGGGVRGGRVIADWPGLAESDREGPGDLKVTTDYRNVLCEIMKSRMGVLDTSNIFPSFVASQTGVMQHGG